MRFLLFFILFIASVFAKELKIASYNVQNLFDISSKDNRYKEYIPNTKSLWNSKNYHIKLKNISKVIIDMDADIVALQEIGSKKALKDLQTYTKIYPYIYIADKKPTTVKVAILSKIKAVYTKEIGVTYRYKYRNILEAKFHIDGKDIYIFVNHWKSKSGSESKRIISAKALRKRIEQLGCDKLIIALGDFNSNYNEYITFRKKHKLNDTHGKTGINHILKTTKLTKKAKQLKYIKGEFYNLWYDVDKKDRYSYLFRGKKTTPDNIIISQSLLRYYKPNSMHSFKKDYLFKGRYIYAWQISRGKIKKHKGKGYSDHLPIVATFNLSKK